jgi:2'-hydroxyisoflavone reductase
LTLGDLLETCREVSGSAAKIRWAPVDFLNRNEVAPWSDLPVWVPDVPEEAGFSRVSISKALAAGLTFRPLAETVRATLDWAQSRPGDYAWRAGLTAEREIELLKRLDAESN